MWGSDDEGVSAPDKEFETALDNLCEMAACLKAVAPFGPARVLSRMVWELKSTLSLVTSLAQIEPGSRTRQQTRVDMYSSVVTNLLHAVFQSRVQAELVQVEESVAKSLEEICEPRDCPLSQLECEGFVAHIDFLLKKLSSMLGMWGHVVPVCVVEGYLVYITQCRESLSSLREEAGEKCPGEADQLSSQQQSEDTLAAPTPLDLPCDQHPTDSPAVTKIQASPSAVTGEATRPSLSPESLPTPACQATLYDTGEIANANASQVPPGSSSPRSSSPLCPRGGSDSRGPDVFFILVVVDRGRVEMTPPLQV